MERLIYFAALSFTLNMHRTASANIYLVICYPLKKQKKKEQNRTENSDTIMQPAGGFCF